MISARRTRSAAGARSGWGVRAVLLCGLASCVALWPVLGAAQSLAQEAETPVEPLPEPPAAAAEVAAPPTSAKPAPGPRAQVQTPPGHVDAQSEIDPSVLLLEPQPVLPAEHEADATAEQSALVPRSVFMPQLRHYYSVLYRSPVKALLWELALPGAGHVYAGFYFQAVVAAGLSLAGAGLWIAGAVKDDRLLTLLGIPSFCIGRAYGLISAPVSAALLNAAYRRQFGIVSF
jgi:hypothetical protein